MLGNTGHRSTVSSGTTEHKVMYGYRRSTNTVENVVVSGKGEGGRGGGDNLRDTMGIRPDAGLVVCGRHLVWHPVRSKNGELMNAGGSIVLGTHQRNRHSGFRFLFDILEEFSTALHVLRSSELLEHIGGT